MPKCAKHGEHKQWVVDVRNGKVTCIYHRVEKRSPRPISKDDVRVMEALNSPTHSVGDGHDGVFSVDTYRIADELDLDHDAVMATIHLFEDLGVIT